MRPCKSGSDRRFMVDPPAGELDKRLIDERAGIGVSAGVSRKFEKVLDRSSGDEYGI